MNITFYKVKNNTFITQVITLDYGKRSQLNYFTIKLVSKKYEALNL